MYSAKNSLKAFISNIAYATSGTTTTTLAELPIGEIGFYASATDLLLPDGIGTGYFAWRKADGQILKSKAFTFAGWVAATKAYAAPTMQKQTVTIPTATASTFYQIRLEMKLVGMLGEYFKHGNYQSAASGDDTTEIATALAASLNANLAREDKEYFTITSSTNTVIIEQKLLPYVRGKKRGRPVAFRAMLSAPEAQAALSALTTAGSDGYGYGPYIAEQEFFAQGDSDNLRFAGYPNSFDDRALVASATGNYNVVAVTIDSPVLTANSDVNAPQQILVAFNALGATPVPTITQKADAATSFTGFSAPGASVILTVNGTPTGAVTAHATTGAWTNTANPATGDVVTATAQLSGSAISAASAAMTVTA